MVIGILSARNNSKFRQAIRDTWLRGLQVNQGLRSRYELKTSPFQEVRKL